MNSTSARRVGGFAPRPTAKKRASDGVDEGPAPKKLRYPVAKAFPFDVGPITVVVGKEKEKFFVHQNIITATSDFFKNAFKDGDVEVMENGVDGDKEWGRWSACYTLSSFLLDTAFGDALIDMAREKLSSDNAFYLEFAQEVYPASVPGSQHRKFAVHIAIETWSDFSFEGEKKDDFPSEFLTDLIVAMGSKLRTGGARRQTPRELFKDVDTCKYHDHTLKNTPCYLETRKHCP